MQLMRCIFFGALVASTIPAFAAPILDVTVELVSRALREDQKELVRQKYAEFNGDLAACRANTNCLVTFYETMPEADLIAYWESLGTPASSRVLSDITNTFGRTRSGLRAPVPNGGKASTKPGSKPTEGAGAKKPVTKRVSKKQTAKKTKKKAAGKANIRKN